MQDSFKNYTFYIFFKGVIFIGALTKSKEFEIRLRYEFGEDLKKLAIIYKVPLSTLKARIKELRK